MDKNNLTPEESLLLISRTIEETKQKFQENGHILILWGSLTFLVFFLQYFFSLVGLYKKFDIIWTCSLFPLGAIYTFFYYRKKVKKNTSKTILSRILGTMGWVVGFNLMIMGFFFGHQLGNTMAPVFLILLAVMTILVGVSIKFKPLIIGGVLLNLIGFGTFVISRDYYGFSMMLGALVGMIIPGILLNKANKKEYV
ncbi:MAG TPA: hypothetical protein VHO72_02680 [Bacteroidales bacterium]|nr:hypothetical protein [Bacteroidales bacterium]